MSVTHMGVASVERSEFFGRVPLSASENTTKWLSVAFGSFEICGFYATN